MTQSSFLIPGEGEEGSDVRVGSVEEEGSLASNSSGFGSLPRKDRPSIISHGEFRSSNIFEMKSLINLDMYFVKNRKAKTYL